MDLGSLFLIFALLILVGLFISKPFFEHGAAVVSQRERTYSTILAEHDRILNALKDLESDYALGKIPDGIYPKQRQYLLLRGAELLKQLDEMREETGSNGSERVNNAFTATVEEAVIPVAEIPGDDHLEEMIAERKRSKTGKAIGFCPQCGSPVQESDLFCSKCGAKIRQDG